MATDNELIVAGRLGSLTQSVDALTKQAGELFRKHSEAIVSINEVSSSFREFKIGQDNVNKNLALRVAGNEDRLAEHSGDRHIHSGSMPVSMKVKLASAIVGSGGILSMLVVVIIEWIKRK